jgi:hypothetical protein
MKVRCLNYSNVYLLLLPNVSLILPSKVVHFLLTLYFPGVAKRYDQCAKYMKSKYGLESAYGLFWNFCLNSPRPDKHIFRIHCHPHVDAKNLALGLCVLYVYGISLLTCLACLRH